MGHPRETKARALYESDIIESLRLAGELIERHNEIKTGRGRVQVRQVKVNQSWDRLLEHLLDHFDGGMCPDDMRTVLDQVCERGLSIDFLINFSQAIVPFAVVRYCLHVHNVDFNAEAVPNWTRFDQRYGEAVTRPLEA